MGLLKNLVTLAEGVTGKMKVRTGLKSIYGNNEIVLTVNLAETGYVLTRMQECMRKDIPIERTERLILIDQYWSAVIEGSQATLYSALYGSADKSNMMVRQAFAGYQHMLHRNVVDEKSLIDTWRIVVTSCCENAQAGTDGYRTGLVYVWNGQEIVHNPAPPEMIKGMMDSLLSYDDESAFVNAIVKAFYLTYIHPFCDGNGRMQRILLQKLAGFPGLPLSDAIHMNLKEYYKSIKACEECVDGVMDITWFYDYIVRMFKQACDLYDEYTSPLNAAQRLVLNTASDKVHGGFISGTEAAEVLGMDIVGANSVIRSLVNAGYMSDMDSVRYAVIGKEI